MNLLNKNHEVINNLLSCSKEILIWIQLQDPEQDIIEISKQTYLSNVKVSLNTFKKGLKELLQKEIISLHWKKNYYKLSKDYFDYREFNNKEFFKNFKAKQEPIGYVDVSKVSILEYSQTQEDNYWKTFKNQNSELTKTTL